MKRTLVFLAFALSLAACSKEQEQPEPVDPVAPIPEEIVGSIPSDDTKAYFDGNASSVTSYVHHFENTDSVSVFWQEPSNIAYKCIDIQQSGTRFKRTFAKNSYSGTCNGRYAIYPYNPDNEVVENGGVPEFGFMLSPIQVYRNDHPGSYGRFSRILTGSMDIGCVGSASVFVATNNSSVQSQKNIFFFYNVGCWLKLELTSADPVEVALLDFHSNDDRVKMSGYGTATGVPGTKSFTVSASDGSYPAVYLYGNVPDDFYGPSMKLTSKGDPIVLSETPTYLYIHLLPTEFVSGFTVDLYDKDRNEITSLNGRYEKVKGRFLRNYVVKMAPVNIDKATNFDLEVEQWTPAASEPTIVDLFDEY